MKSDVKAIRKNATGSVFAGRTRLRGIILSNTTTTTTSGYVKLVDGNNATQFEADVPPGDVFSFNIPEDGILFVDGMTVTTLTSSIVTVLIDK